MNLEQLIDKLKADLKEYNPEYHERSKSFMLMARKGDIVGAISSIYLVPDKNTIRYNGIYVTGSTERIDLVNNGVLNEEEYEEVVKLLKLKFLKTSGISSFLDRVKGIDISINFYGETGGTILLKSEINKEAINKMKTYLTQNKKLIHETISKFINVDKYKKANIKIIRDTAALYITFAGTLK